MKRVDTPPLLLCAFRPFFLFASASAAIAMLWWLGYLFFDVTLPAMPGGAIVWHAHAMIFAFSLAAVAGFVLTAVPEFTATAAVGARAVATMALLWIVSRLAAVAVGVLGVVPVMVLDIALCFGLIVLLVPRIRCDPARRHVSLLWALLAWLGITIGFYTDVLRGLYPMRWAYAAIGLMMILIVIVMSRVSMRIVNAALDDRGETTRRYLARPPRRQLAISSIALFTLMEFFAPGSPSAGWLALAASAAILNLLNDWHLGRVLAERWVALLYSVYVFMALGYGAIGAALIGGVGSVSGSRHVLTIGALGLSIFVIMNIAGRVHTGRTLDTRRWIPICAALLGAAALIRALSTTSVGLALSGGIWIVVFGLFFCRYVSIYLSPRPDDGEGCAGVMPDAAGRD